MAAAFASWFVGARAVPIVVESVAPVVGAAGSGGSLTACGGFDAADENKRVDRINDGAHAIDSRCGLHVNTDRAAAAAEGWTASERRGAANPMDAPALLHSAAAAVARREPRDTATRA